MDFGEGLVFESEGGRAAAMEDYNLYEGYSQEEWSRRNPASDDEDEDGPVGGFPPKLMDWKDVDYSQPGVTVDKARGDLYEQYLAEHDFVTGMIEKLPQEIPGGDEQDKVASLLFGPNSKVFRLFHDAIAMPYDKFCHFLATFYFVCRMNQNWKELWKDEDINTERFMPPTIFYRVLRKIDEYGKDEHWGLRFWEELEDAFNQTMSRNFIPRRKAVEKRKKNEFSKLCLITDDDKAKIALGPKRKVPPGEESKLRRARQVRKNRTGIVCNVTCHAASDIPIASKFEHEDHQKEVDCFIELMRAIFNFRGEAVPNLSGRTTMAMDRGYMRIAILGWWLKTGGDVIGTIMRGQGWIPFTFAKKGQQSRRKSNPDVEDVPADGYKTVHQKTVKYRLGNSGPKPMGMTCTTYTSGHSSSVAMFLQSREHGIEWDLVTARPSDLKRYRRYSTRDGLSRGNPDEHKELQFMDGFQRVAGEDWLDLKDAAQEQEKAAKEDEETEVSPSGSEDDEAPKAAAASKKRVKIDKEAESSSSDSEGDEVPEDKAEREEVDGGDPPAAEPYRHHAEVLKGQGLEPQTREQLDNGWWICRQMALSLSNSNEQIVAAAPFIDRNHPMREHFRRILCYSGQLSLLPDDDDGDDVAGADDDDNDEAGGGDGEAGGADAAAGGGAEDGGEEDGGGEENSSSEDEGVSISNSMVAEIFDSDDSDNPFGNGDEGRESADDGEERASADDEEEERASAGSEERPRPRRPVMEDVTEEEQERERQQVERQRREENWMDLVESEEEGRGGSDGQDENNQDRNADDDESSIQSSASDAAMIALLERLDDDGIGAQLGVDDIRAFCRWIGEHHGTSNRDQVYAIIARVIRLHGGGYTLREAYFRNDAVRNPIEDNTIELDPEAGDSDREGGSEGEGEGEGEGEDDAEDEDFEGEDAAVGGNDDDDDDHTLVSLFTLASGERSIDDSDSESDDDSEVNETSIYENSEGGFLLYSRRDGAHEEYLNGLDVSDDADAFLEPFLREYRGDVFNALCLEEAEDLIRDVDSEFVRLCLDKIGAPSSWKGQKARDELIAWFNLEDYERPIAFHTKNEMIAIAEENGFSIPKSLKVGAYREKLGKLLNGEEDSRNSDGDSSVGSDEPEEDLQRILMRSMLVASFMKRLKKGSEEGQSKYSLMGQRVERPVLNTFWKAYEQKDEKDLGEFETLYSPGLVRRCEAGWIKDSADGCLLRRVEGKSVATPVEIKARVSANTFHRTVARFNRQRGISDMPGVGSQANRAEFIDIGAEDEHLLGLVPESNDLFQILHHAHTYGTESCFYLISSHTALLYNLHVTFPGELLDSYKAVLNWLYEQTLADFYVEGADVPDLWDSVERAFQHQKLKHLKMTKHSFQVYLGLWRALNVNFDGLQFPLPPLARIVPLVTAIWNTLKGGGDTVTKLDEICQERLGIRTEITVAVARILLNIGVVFHRCNQMLTLHYAPSEYPTLHHIRDASNHRFTTKQSLKVLYNKLLRRGNKSSKAAEEEEEPVELVNCCPSPAEPPVRKSSRNAPKSPLIQMPCPAVRSGKTPGKGQSIDKPSPEFVQRCLECDGLYPAEKISRNKDKKDGKGKPVKKEDDRRSCHVCKRKTRHHCFRCRRYLCNDQPLGGKGRDDKKYHPHFLVRVPVLNDDGSIKRDKENRVEYETEYGKLTCWHIAHSDFWKENLRTKYLLDQQPAPVSAEDKEKKPAKKDAAGGKQGAKKDAAGRKKGAKRDAAGEKKPAKKDAAGGKQGAKKDAAGGKKGASRKKRSRNN